MKKILSLIIAVVMIMGTMACVSVSAATEMPEAVDGKITLTSNVELTDTYTVPAGTTLTIDLAGYTISQTKTQTAGYQMILNDGNLTIKDSSKSRSGKISYTDNGNGGEYISDTIYNRGVLVIESGTIENLSTETVARNGYPHAVDTYSGIRDTSVTVKGGTIYCAEYSAMRMFCVSETNKADLVINNGIIIGAVDVQNGSKDKACLGSLTVNGGIFDTNKSSYNVRIADWHYYGSTANISGISADIKSGSFDKGIYKNIAPVSEFVSGGVFGEDVTEFLADGATVVCGDKKYVKNDGEVSAVAPTEVDTYEKLLAALEVDKAQVVMTKDITADATQSSGYGKAGIVLDAGDFLDGNGYKLTINDANTTWDCAIAMRGGKVQDLTIAGAMRGVFMPGANGNVEIDNCVFEDVVYTFNSDAGSKGASVTITNTKLFGWTSFSNVHKSVTFENCEFGEGSGYSYCRPYQPTTFIGCDFSGDFEFDAKKTADNSLEFTDCTIAGEELSAENAAPMFSNGANVVIDDEEVAFDTFNAVASVGGKRYESLAEAIEAAEDGETITLVNDITIDEETRTFNSGSYYDGVIYDGDKSFTIDLGGYTITHDSSVNDYLLNFKNNGSKDNTITLKNGKIEAGASAYCAICTSSSTKKITINTENINIIGNNKEGSVIKIRSGAVLNVNADTVITGNDSYLGIECIASTVNINDGAEIYMNGTSSYNGCLVGTGTNGTVNVNGGYGKGVAGGFIAMTSGGTINVYGGEWIADTDGTVSGNDYVLIAQSDKATYNGDNSVVNVTGGTFKGGYNCYGNAVGDAQLNISGGIFDTDPTAYVTEGFEVKDNGDGTYSVKEELVPPTTINNIDDLKAFRDAVNSGYTYSGEKVTLACDIDLANEEWTPIGNSTYSFQGHFDGGNHTIKNLKVTMPGKSNVGFFGMTTNGSVKNLTIENADIEGRLNVGVVAGTPYTSTYANIKLTGHITVDGMSYVGGVGGKNAYANWSGITINADNTSYVKADSIEDDIYYRTYVGGVVGFMGEGGHKFTNITSNIDVTGTVCDVGGIVGIAHYNNVFENCVSTGDVKIEGYKDEGKNLEMGGIAGTWHNENGTKVTFINCKFAGTLTSINIDGVLYEGEYANNGLIGKQYSSSGTGELVIINFEWATGTDAGFYMVSETEKAGVMRFLFAADITDEILESGIKYIKTSDISAAVSATGVKGTEKAFYGDVTGIPEGTEGTYIAVAYVTTANGTYWSDAVECSPNFTKLFTEYNPAQ